MATVNFFKKPVKVSLVNNMGNVILSKEAKGYIQNQQMIKLYNNISSFEDMENTTPFCTMILSNDINLLIETM